MHEKASNPAVNGRSGIVLPIKKIDSLSDIAKLIKPEDGGTFFAETVDGKMVVVERNKENYVVKFHKTKGKREYFECIEYDNDGNIQSNYFESD